MSAYGQIKIRIETLSTLSTCDDAIHKIITDALNIKQSLNIIIPTWPYWSKELLAERKLKCNTCTFCGTWYLPHSQVHNDRTVLIKILAIWSPSLYKCLLHIFYGACAIRPYFYFWSKIWRHNRVSRPWFPIKCGNLGDLPTFKADIELLR